MSVPKTDYDAAQALLDLQGTVKRENTEPCLWHSYGNIQNVDMSAKILWNRFISSDVQALPSLDSQAKAQTTSKIEYTQSLKPVEVYTDTHNKPRMVTKINKPLFYGHSDLKAKVIGVPISNPSDNLFLQRINNRNSGSHIETKDVTTQTEERYCHPNIEFMENTIKKLYERIQSLEKQIKKPDDLIDHFSDLGSSENDDNIDDQSYNSLRESLSRTGDNSFDEPNLEDYRHHSKRMCFENSDERRFGNSQNKSRLPQKVISNTNSYTKSSDLIPIGDGNASVPARLLKHINWNSYTSATRKLLTAVFSRRILATHSLTGKPSPAFPNKPAKKKLDPVLVNDIVQTVVERCSVPENVVRTSITTKCADESKMFKTRKSNYKKHTGKKNSENVPPTTSESEDY